jgi:VWFA-related protein
VSFACAFFLGTGLCGFGADSEAASPVAIESRARNPKQTAVQANLRVDTSLVLIPLAVTDRANHPVLGLQKSDFRVFDRNQEQQVLNLSFQDAPLAVGLVFDTSGSMAHKIPKARAAVAEFLKTANPEDEFFLVEFDNTVRLTQPLTSDTAEIQARLATAAANGQTALLDAIGLALSEMKRSHNPRKALVIVSDGGDNRSRYTEAEIRDLLRESEVSIYAMGIFDMGTLLLSPEEIEGPGLLDGLAERSGGRLWAVSDLRDLPAIAARIGAELHSSYVLGYAPANLQPDGKYHRVKVTVAGRNGLPLHVDWRPGYRAPEQ